MIGVVLVLLCVGFVGLSVLFLRLAYRVMRLENGLQAAAQRLGEPGNE